ncbi:MAG: NUDIX hydrolase [Patescibacteria group bacterium]|nr:NUDIX hydrolase [Patescibacteria group bacterium]
MPMYRLSAKALVYNENKQFLLIKEVKGIRDFPGGGIEYGETPQEAIKRELSEELGITKNVEVNEKITHFLAYYYQEKEVGV